MPSSHVNGLSAGQPEASGAATSGTAHSASFTAHVPSAHWNQPSGQVAGGGGGGPDGGRYQQMESVQRSPYPGT